MSLLPQRKKSAEEIAKLRESLGIPGVGPGEEKPAEAAPDPVQAPAVVESAPAAPGEKEAVKALTLPEPAALAPLPIDDEPPTESVPLLGPVEPIPVLPLDGEVTSVKVEKLPAKTDSTLPALQVAKTVKSLRKSEQGPVFQAKPPAADSKLPVHKRTDEELNELRRRAALSNISQQAPPKPLAAHIAVIAPGYVLAIVAAACFYYYELSLVVTASCVGLALIIAGLIFYRWPLSRHHAAFIAVISLFVIVFGTLYYFPNLQHGS